MDVINVGNRITLVGTFRNTSRALADPTTVTLRHEDPSGNVTAVAAGSITRESLGVYTFDLDVDEAGMWYYRFIGDGALIATNPEQFLAEASRP